jgi:predicted HTH transcriptional regulator
MSVERPTRALIESKKIVEGQHYDFKRGLELDRKPPHGAKDGKARFIDDLVAFANSDAGYLIVGVEEKDGVWSRILNAILDNIDPAPKVDLEFIDVNDGYIFYIAMPRQGMQPYVNKITGSYYERVGSRNRPISRGEVQARFKS